eukprot:4316602-Ditylum_brightwellii.AAC.1
MFTGLEGIEGLIYVVECFRKVTKQLNFDTGPELLDNFEEVVMDNAEEKWVNHVQNIIDVETRDID